MRRRLNPSVLSPPLLCTLSSISLLFKIASDKKRDGISFASGMRICSASKERFFSFCLRKISPTTLVRWRVYSTASNRLNISENPFFSRPRRGEKGFDLPNRVWLVHAPSALRPPPTALPRQTPTTNSNSSFPSLPEGGGG